MPANLPPQYIAAEQRYRAAKDVEDKIAALQEMLAVMPRHKGTDKLHAGLRSKIAKLSQESERKAATARRAGFYIRREGAGQVVLTGSPNAGTGSPDGAGLRNDLRQLWNRSPDASTGSPTITRPDASTGSNAAGAATGSPPSGDALRAALAALWKGGTE